MRNLGAVNLELTCNKTHPYDVFFYNEKQKSIVIVCFFRSNTGGLLFLFRTPTSFPGREERGFPSAV